MSSTETKAETEKTEVKIEPTPKALSRKQWKRKKLWWSRQRAIKRCSHEEQFNGKAIHDLNKRARYLRRKGLKKRKEAIEKAKQASKIASISAIPLKPQFKSSEASIEFRNNTTVRKESRSLFKESEELARKAENYEKIAKLKSKNKADDIIPLITID